MPKYITENFGNLFFSKIDENKSDILDTRLDLYSTKDELDCLKKKIKRLEKNERNRWRYRWR